jgi:hypothetical protein
MQRAGHFRRNDERRVGLNIELTCQDGADPSLDVQDDRENVGRLVWQACLDLAYGFMLLFHGTQD